VGDNDALSILLATEPVPVSELGSAWEPIPAVLAAAALAAALYAQGFVRLRRRGRADHASIGRAVAFGLGLVLLVLALCSPLDAVGEGYLLSAHMLQHVLIGDAAVALMLLGLSGPMLFFFLPRAPLRQVAHLQPLRRTLSVLVTPWVAFGIWCAVFATWHVPALYDLTPDNQALHDVEHLCFVLAGLLVWYSLLGLAGRGAPSRPRRLALAVALFAAGQILAMVLIFSFEPLYPAYADQPERLLGLSPMMDQRLAGLVMMAEMTITLGSLAAFLLLATDRTLRRQQERPALRAEPRP
jgi:cytochrome c oxidase assembly factor CtaG